jgi:hypothetical protein
MIAKIVPVKNLVTDAEHVETIMFGTDANLELD